MAELIKDLEGWQIIIKDQDGNVMDERDRKVRRKRNVSTDLFIFREKDALTFGRGQNVVVHDEVSDSYAVYLIHEIRQNTLNHALEILCFTYLRWFELEPRDYYKEFKPEYLSMTNQQITEKFLEEIDRDEIYLTAEITPIWLKDFIDIAEVYNAKKWAQVRQSVNKERNFLVRYVCEPVAENFVLVDIDNIMDQMRKRSARDFETMLKNLTVNGFVHSSSKKRQKIKAEDTDNTVTKKNLLHNQKQKEPESHELKYQKVQLEDSPQPHHKKPQSRIDDHYSVVSDMPHGRIVNTGVKPTTKKSSTSSQTQTDHTQKRKLQSDGGKSGPSNMKSTVGNGSSNDNIQKKRKTEDSSKTPSNLHTTMTGVSRSTGVTSDAGKVVDKEIIKNPTSVPSQGGNRTKGNDMSKKEPYSKAIAAANQLKAGRTNQKSNQTAKKPSTTSSNEREEKIPAYLSGRFQPSEVIDSVQSGTLNDLMTQVRKRGGVSEALKYKAKNHVDGTGQDLYATAKSFTSNLRRTLLGSENSAQSQQQNASDIEKRKPYNVIDDFKNNSSAKILEHVKRGNTVSELLCHQPIDKTPEKSNDEKLKPLLTALSDLTTNKQFVQLRNIVGLTAQSKNSGSIFEKLRKCTTSESLIQCMSDSITSDIILSMRNKEFVTIYGSLFNAIINGRNKSLYLTGDDEYTIKYVFNKVAHELLLSATFEEIPQFKLASVPSSYDNFYQGLWQNISGDILSDTEAAIALDSYFSVMQPVQRFPILIYIENMDEFFNNSETIYKDLINWFLNPLSKITLICNGTVVNNEIGNPLKDIFLHVNFPSVSEEQDCSVANISKVINQINSSYFYFNADLQAATFCEFYKHYTKNWQKINFRINEPEVGISVKNIQNALTLKGFDSIINVHKHIYQCLRNVVNRYIDSTAKKNTVDIQANQLSVSAGSANTHYDLMEPLYGRIMSSLAELTFVDKLVLFCTVLCRLRKSSVEKIDLNEVYNVIVDVLHHNCDNSPMISNLLLTYSTIKNRNDKGSAIKLFLSSLMWLDVFTRLYRTGFVTLHVDQEDRNQIKVALAGFEVDSILAELKRDSSMSWIQSCLTE